MSIEEFAELKKRVDEESHEKAMTVENRRRHNPKRLKKEIVIAGDGPAPATYEGIRSKAFDGLEFCVLSEATKPYKKTKTQIEAMIKENGGVVSQKVVPGSNMVIIADKKVVKVASLIKSGGIDIIRSKWIQDCLDQGTEGFILPYEDSHVLHATDELRAMTVRNNDQFGDSYARDVSVEELRDILAGIPKIEDGIEFDKGQFLEQLEAHGKGLSGLRGFMFQRCVVYFHCVDQESKFRVARLTNYIRYGGGACRDDVEDELLTHVIIVGEDAAMLGTAGDDLRRQLSSKRRLPRLVHDKWVEESWKEISLLDEEGYHV